MYYIKLTEQIKDEIHQKISSLIERNEIQTIINKESWHDNWLPLSSGIEINFAYPKIFMHENIPLMVEFLQVLTAEELFSLLRIETVAYHWMGEEFDKWPFNTENQDTLDNFLSSGIINRQESTWDWELNEAGEAMKRTILMIICLLQIEYEEFPSKEKRFLPNFMLEKYYTDLLNQLRVRSKELI